MTPPGAMEEIDEDDNNSFCFVGHCPEVLCKLPPNIRSSLGMTITRKRAFTTELVNSIIDDAAGHMGFQRMQKKLAGQQKGTFFNLKRDFYGLRANTEMQGNINGGVDTTNCDISLNDVIPYPFPSWNYVQAAFVKWMLDRLPFFERHLRLISGKFFVETSPTKLSKLIYTAANVEGQTRGRKSVKA
jgi:hypothetical protein